MIKYSDLIYMPKKDGNRQVKILVLVEGEDLNYWNEYFGKAIIRLSNIEIALFPKSTLDDFKAFIQKDKQEVFIFILDLSKNNSVVSGYGDRVLGILEKSLASSSIKPSKLDEKYAVWYSEHYEFSTLQIGRKIKDFNKSLELILSYFNGKQN